MACSPHALGQTLCNAGVRNSNPSTSSTLAVTRLKSPHLCRFNKVGFLDTGPPQGWNFPFYTLSPSILGLSQRHETQSTNSIHESVQSGGSLSLQEAQSAVAENLISAGIDQEDAVQISENAPIFIQKLMEGLGDPQDEIDSWAKLSAPAEGPDPSTSGSHEVMQWSTRMQWAVVIESVGVRAQNVNRVAHVLSSSSLPEFLKKVRFLEEVLYRAQVDGQALERKVHQMMLRLSVAADEELQHTLSFFEKMEARRGGLASLQSTPFAIARLIEEFPEIFLRGLDTELRPTIAFLETLGVPDNAVGRVVLLYPPVLLCDIERDLQSRLRTLKKVGVRARDLGKMVARYPWLLSRSAQNNVNEVVEFLFSIKVAGGEVDRSITRCPQLLGCSSIRTMQPMVQRMNELGVKSKRLGRVIACSPQLLVHTPEEFNEVVSFLEKIGVEPKDMGGMLKRSPELFASDVSGTLESKVQFLRELGIKEELIWRVLRMFPEMLSMSVKESLRPRMDYLREWKLTKNNIAVMVCKFPPLLGYNIESVLKPKLGFLVNSMGRQVYEVVEYPRYFSYSLEKRILPRARVIERRKISCDLKTMLAKNDEEFASEFLGLGRMLVPPM